MSEGSHLPADSDAEADPSIPLLTDRIFLPAVELDTALPASLVAPTPPATTEQPEPSAAVPEPSVRGAAPAGEPLVQHVEASSADRDASGERVALEAEAPIEAELDRDLVAASDADFEALLSAEQQLAPSEVASEPIAAEAARAAPPAAAEGGADARVASAAAAPLADGAAMEAQAEALRAAVLQRVADRLPERVNAAVRDLMQPAIDQAMARLGEEAEVALRIALQELVDQALREELSRHEGGDSRR